MSISGFTTLRQNSVITSDGGVWPVKSSVTAYSCDLSIVIPCFNEAEGIALTIQRLIQVIESIHSSFELVLINDGSTDRTWAIIAEMAAGDQRIRGANLSRNFGQDAALTAGITMSRGELVLLIDADLQDPPELLGEMMSKLNEGFDVVYGQRISRDGESWFKRSSAYLFYRLFDLVSETSIPRDTGYFRLMRRRVAEAVLLMPERNRYLRGMLSWVGFRQVALPYKRDVRRTGQSHWPITRMIHLAKTAFWGFSETPLAAALWGGIGFLLVSAIAGIVWAAAQFPTDGIGLVLTLVSITTFCAGSQLMILYSLGIYLSRIAKDAQQRPTYIVGEDLQSVFSNQSCGKCSFDGATSVSTFSS
ncbi:glycosyltransferase family 2 protein [Bremerella sp.]|uniref:glycosyltransferase family 2 protein n=1 Tax=Bremerella sp. TaxID=2795602 RepID=UPI00391C1198